MIITNIERSEAKDKTDNQIAYEIALTIDNMLVISGIYVLYTYCDNGAPYTIKWPLNVTIFNDEFLSSIEAQILDGLDKIPLKEKLKQKLQSYTHGIFTEELIKIIDKTV
ncbi:MAG: hypothetical protein MJ170_02610 [Alphaproteobacteria bacterium]|nr:hypothetical protein [Alphaproteobacteria bacterium]